MNPDLNPCSPGLYNAPTPWDLNPSPSRGIGSTNILSPNHNSPLRATVSSSSSSSSSSASSSSSSSSSCDGRGRLA